MNILLGIYRTPTFREQLKDSSLQTYPFSELLTDWDHYMPKNGIIDLVAMACSHCDIIYFVLDEIRLPLSDIPYTCNELKMILRNKRFLNKTIFILDNKELTNEEFDNWLNQ